MANAEGAGFARPANAGNSTVWRILDDHDIKPLRIHYYLEKRDPDFDRKMQEVLMVYRDVSRYTEGVGHDARPTVIYTVSVVRHGTVSILAGIDLHSGHIFANVVEERRRNVQSIRLLKQLDAHYPEEAIIRVVLDSHSAPTYLSGCPGRFEDVHTPEHGSWLNLTECALSKMALFPETHPRHIQRLFKQSIPKGIA